MQHKASFPPAFHPLTYPIIPASTTIKHFLGHATLTGHKKGRLTGNHHLSYSSKSNPLFPPHLCSKPPTEDSPIVCLQFQWIKQPSSQLIPFTPAQQALPKRAGIPWEPTSHPGQGSRKLNWSSWLLPPLLQILYPRLTTPSVEDYLLKPLHRSLCPFLGHWVDPSGAPCFPPSYGLPQAPSTFLCVSSY